MMGAENNFKVKTTTVTINFKTVLSAYIYIFNLMCFHTSNFFLRRKSPHLQGIHKNIVYSIKHVHMAPNVVHDKMIFIS